MKLAKLNQGKTSPILLIATVIVVVIALLAIIPPAKIVIGQDILEETKNGLSSSEQILIDDEKTISNEGSSTEELEQVVKDSIDDNEITEDEANDIKNEANLAATLLLGKLEERINELNPSEEDSQELTQWKTGLQACLTNIKTTFEKDWISLDNNAPPESIEAFTQDVQKCEEEFKTSANSLSDPNDRSEANAELKKSQMILGAVLMIVGAIMMAFGVPYGLTVFAVGLSMVAETVDGDGSSNEEHGGGVNNKTQSESEGQSEEGPPLPQDLTDEGFKSYGGNSGNISFLFSAKTQSWKVVNTSDNFNVIFSSKLADTDNMDIFVSNENDLSNCDLVVEIDPAKIELNGELPCPNFTLVPNESRWLALKNDDIPTTTVN